MFLWYVGLVSFPVTVRTGNPLYPADVEHRTKDVRKQMLQPCSSTSSFKVPQCKGCTMTLVSDFYGSWGSSILLSQFPQMPVAQSLFLYFFLVRVLQPSHDFLHKTTTFQNIFLGSYQNNGWHKNHSQIISKSFLYGNWMGKS